MLNARILLAVAILAGMFCACVSGGNGITNTEEPIVQTFFLSDIHSLAKGQDDVFIQEQIWGNYDKNRLALIVFGLEEEGMFRTWYFYEQDGIKNGLALLTRYKDERKDKIEINKAQVVGEKGQIYFKSVENPEQNDVLYFWTPGEKGTNIDTGSVELSVVTDKGTFSIPILAGVRHLDIQDCTNQGQGSMEFLKANGLWKFPVLENATASWFVNSGSEKVIPIQVDAVGKDTVIR